MTRSPRLPGFGPDGRRRGRNERAVAGVAKLLRDTATPDAFDDALLTLARTTGASLDRLEVDTDRSEHTVGAVARVHAAVLDQLRPAAGPAGGDAFERLTDELAAAVRHDPTT